MPEIYLLALVVCLAAGLAIIVSRFKQPLLVSYVAAGAVLSAFHLAKPEQLEFLAILPEVGLAFLLFLVGMELDLREFRRLGRNVLIATFAQIIITTAVLTFFTHSFLIAVVTAFSSTILVVKILLEEKEQSSLHGKLSIGILLVEDLLAILLLMFMTIPVNPAAMLGVAAKGIFLIWVALVAGKRILPRIISASGENPELLILTAIGWCLLFVSVTVYAGFSLPIGAFLAGISLAQSAYRLQISGRMKPLRDFFIMIFFLGLGTGLSISGVMSALPLAIGLLLYSVIIKPLIFVVLFSRLGYRIHSAFQTGIYISSISEFSLIVLSQASRQGIIPKEYLSPFIFATVFSFIFSSLLVTHRRKIFTFLAPHLKHLERPSRLESVTRERNSALDGHAVLIGCHRSGQIILKSLEKLFGERLLVLDFNPDVVEELRMKAVNCLYGDLSDPEVLEQINLHQAKLVISTVRDFKDNAVLLDYIEKIQSKATIIATADEVTDAIKLYERGAHHVSLPMSLEGHSISRLIAEHIDDFSFLAYDRERKLGELKRWQSS